jgi:choline kinase
MKAVILAAGVGKRLYPVTQHRPKCLIDIGGRSLLSRYLEQLAALGIRQTVIVVGHKQEMIREAVAANSYGMSVRFLVNEQFHRGSISSLWEARTELNDDVVVMDADVLFHPEILRRLVKSSFSSCLLMDDTVKQETEECMVVVEGGRVIALTKRMPERYDLAGEGVGFLRVGKQDVERIVDSLTPYIDRGEWNMEYEDALKEFFAEVKVGFERIGGLPWIEIDFAEDVARAERDIVPKLA